jgi:tRNA G46 methylase TrmB
MHHLRAISKKPVGQPTRGKTASNRLRRVDNFILLYEPSLLTRTDGLFADSVFVDLGYGFDARTTLESASRFRRLNPDLRVLGVEIDKDRVEAALPYADEKTIFRLGGFNLPLQESEHVRLIRAFNVWRQYEEKDFRPRIIDLLHIFSQVG